jgi:hypothetical protein
MTAERIRREVEGRLASRKTQGKAPEETAYLLMLVRPTGIETYYRTLIALDKLEIDFGYEFVEADWVLNFPNEGETAVQPWMAAEKPDRETSPVPRNSAAIRSPGDSSFSNSTSIAIAASGSAPNKTGSTKSSAGSVLSDSGSTSQSDGGPPTSAGRDTPPNLNAGVGGTIGSTDALGSSPQVLSGRVPGGSQGSPGQGTFGLGPSLGSSPAGLPVGPVITGGSMVPGGPANGTPADLEVPRANLGKPFAQPGVNGNGAPIASSHFGGGSGADTQNGLAAAGTGAASPGSIPDAIGRSPGNVVSPPSNQAGSFNAKPGAADHAEPGTGFAAGWANSSGSSDTKASGAIANPLASGPASSDTQAQGRSSESPPESSNPLFKPPVPPAAEKPGRSVQPRVRAYGNRDFVITIDCTAKGLLVTPGEFRFAAETLSRGSTAGEPLVQFVQGLITRRQAMLRPGEPPYRPEIRFVVEPDGLQSYYLAYPLLGSLGVPITRENVRKEDKDREPAPSARVPARRSNQLGGT